LTPARVSIESSVRSVNPRSKTSFAMQRIPFPHISATPPSALQ
jgi:hypothetical protein